MLIELVPWHAVRQFSRRHVVSERSLLALGELLVELLLLHHRLLLVLHFAVPQLALLHGDRLEACELRLGHLLGVVGVMRHEQQLLVLRLLGAQLAVELSDLVVVPDALLLEPLYNLVVSPPVLVRLLVPLDRLRKLALECADLLGGGALAAGATRFHRLLREIAKLVSDAVKFLPLLHVGMCELVVLPPQLADLVIKPLHLCELSRMRRIVICLRCHLV
mmetsp:Transcript_25004/g.64527  ORF Transcript_25004/g.64527 Transcript_25004/m.64527 type:complete len:220 (+) Transcript_25004:1068-1727(+)